MEKNRERNFILRLQTICRFPRSCRIQTNLGLQQGIDQGVLEWEERKGRTNGRMVIKRPQLGAEGVCNALFSIPGSRTGKCLLASSSVFVVVFEVIPAEAGIQLHSTLPEQKALDARLRGHDGQQQTTRQLS